MRIRLTKKFADRIDGVDLHRHFVGDLLDLEPSEATLLIAEGWALAERRTTDRRHYVSGTSDPRASLRAMAADCREIVNRRRSSDSGRRARPTRSRRG